MLQQIELWGFLAGLGLFLLGMYFLEQGLRGLGSKAMKKFLREQTRSPIRGVFTGTLVTAFLQSSSLVGLSALAFVGAGIFELRNALGIILGSNLGTTFTGWIVTLIGFKMNLGVFAQPMLAVGALGTVFL
ncbi:MAG: Na/Pi symporter, partial [Gammaproteobacteria bacterium]